MKHRPQYICVPVSLFDNTQLTVLQKWVLIAIDSTPQDINGAAIRPGALATALGVTKKDVVAALKELGKRGAIEISIDDNGQQLYKALMYKDGYAAIDSINIVEGEKPNTEQIDFDYIMEQWNVINPALPQLTRMTPQRKLKTRTCLKKNGMAVADLIKVFHIVASSSFLQRGTDGQWCADFDWLIRDNKGQIQKILEGGFSRSYQERMTFEQIMGNQIQTSTNEDEYQ